MKEGTYTPDKPDPNNTTYDWGVTMTLENVTATGCTLKVTRSGGSPTEEVECGYDYWMERLTDDGWKAVELLRSHDVPAIAFIVSEEPQTFEIEINWGPLYDTLPGGTYRIGKTIMDWRAPGDYDEQDHYTEPFTIGIIP